MDFDLIVNGYHESTACVETTLSDTPEHSTEAAVDCFLDILTYEDLPEMPDRNDIVSEAWYDHKYTASNGDTYRFRES